MHNILYRNVMHDTDQSKLCKAHKIRKNSHFEKILSKEIRLVWP